MKLLLMVLAAIGLTLGQGPMFPPDPRLSPQRPPNATLIMGDIALTPEQAEERRMGKFTFNAIIGEKYRWKDAIIPYEIDCSISNLPRSVAAVHAAMAQWERKTCIRFVPYTNQEFHLTFFRNTHCWGNVGQVPWSHISVGPGCDYEHVMAHEIGHVIGLYHEQNRKDRDDWVEIFWDNIGQFKDAFDIVKNTDNMGIQYDYESIMHYPWTAFSINGKPTMAPKKDRKGKVPYVEISKDDIRLVSRMYKCPEVERKREEEKMQKRYRIEKELAHEPSPNKFDRFDCIDRDKRCEEWADGGQCHIESVHDMCKRSCLAETCFGGPCKDQYAACPEWKEWGHCKFVDSVQIYCQKSCNPACQGRTTPKPPPTTKHPKPTTKHKPTRKPTKPTPTTPAKSTKKGKHDWYSWPNYNYLGTGFRCFDYYEKCKEWADAGECERNAGWMTENCRNSCPNARCDREVLKPEGTCVEPLGLSVGLDGKYTLPDSAMTATSALSPGGGWKAEGRNSRLYFEDDYDNKRIGAWCAGNRDPQHIDVDLGQERTISYIATQGRPNFFERVSKFKILYSNNGVDYKVFQEGGKDREFYGNCDHSSPVLNKFMGQMKARYIRYVPIDWNWPCVRMEFYGC